MITSTPTWTLTMGYVQLPILSGTLNISAQAMPAVGGGFVVPFDQQIYDALDARSFTLNELTVRGERTYWTSNSLAYLSEMFEGMTLGEVSAAFDGMTLGDVSEMFGTPLTEGAPAENESIDLTLYSRGVSKDLRSGTMTIIVSSSEVWLTDWAIANSADVAALDEVKDSLAPNTLRWNVEPAVSVAIGKDVDFGPYGGNAMSGEYEVPDLKGMTAFEAIRGALEDKDLSLRVQPNGDFVLKPPMSNITGNLDWFEFWPYDTIDVVEEVNRNGDWYDSAYLISRQDSGALKTAGYPSTFHSRTWVEYMPDNTKPTTAMAQAIVNRTKKRGHTITLTAPARMGIWYRDYFVYWPVLEPVESEIVWQVDSVSYDLFTDRMTLTGIIPD
ncbi:hypothetical protein ACFO6V_27980 [Promicromonospora alba]|uniref:Uncharacterized protein n=1 Tax=Promicromonospora alba TaxID=1616110 RepID=A0ABV9HQF3_9MICO